MLLAASTVVEPLAAETLDGVTDEVPGNPFVPDEPVEPGAPVGPDVAVTAKAVLESTLWLAGRMTSSCDVDA